MKCEKLLLKSKRYSSYKITIWSNDAKFFEDPDVWPEGLVVSKYYQGAKKSDRELNIFEKKN